MDGGRHINEPGKWYFNNLQYFNPFIYNSLIPDGFIVNRLNGILATAYTIFKFAVTVGVVLMVLSVCIKNVRNKKVDHFNLLTFLIIVFF